MLGNELRKFDTGQVRNYRLPPKAEIISNVTIVGTEVLPNQSLLTALPTLIRPLAKEPVHIFFASPIGCSIPAITTQRQVIAILTSDRCGNR